MALKSVRNLMKLKMKDFYITAQPLFLPLALGAGLLTRQLETTLAVHMD